MPRGKKTSPKTVYAIMASWAITNSYAETARGLGLAPTTVESIVKENKDKLEFVELRAEKKQEFSKNADRIIYKTMDRLEKDIDNSDKDIPVNHLTNVIGVLFDKKTLAEGKPTEKMVVEVKLPEGIDEYAG